MIHSALVGNLHVITENASLPAGDVTKKMIVVIAVTNKIVVCVLIVSLKTKF